MSPIRWPFSSQLITSNFSLILLSFANFFTWVALGDVDLCFSLMLLRKANAVEEDTK